MLMSSGPTGPHRSVNRRDFLREAAAGGAGAMALIAVNRGRALAQAPASYPDWIAPSTKPVKRGGAMARATATGPAGARSAPDEFGGPLPDRLPRLQPARPLSLRRRGQRNLGI